MIEIIFGLVAAAGMILLSVFLYKYFTPKLLAAATLVAIAFIYLGFALIANTFLAIILECTIAFLFFFYAVIGYSRKPVLLAFGILLHGVWDILHYHDTIVAINIPSYWFLFCLSVDLVYGIFLLYLFYETHQ